MKFKEFFGSSWILPGSRLRKANWPTLASLSKMWTQDRSRKGGGGAQCWCDTTLQCYNTENPQKNAMNPGNCPETAAVRNRESYCFGSIPSFLRRSVCSVRMWSWVGVMLQFGTIFCMALFLMIATLPCQISCNNFFSLGSEKFKICWIYGPFMDGKKGLDFLSTHLRLMVNRSISYPSIHFSNDFS